MKVPISVLGFIATLILLILMVTGVAPFNLFLMLLPLIIVAAWWIMLFVLGFVVGIIAYLVHRL